MMADIEETEVCMHCGRELRRGIKHWLHRHPTRETLYCRDDTFTPLKPLTRAEPCIWTEAE